MTKNTYPDTTIERGPFRVRLFHRDGSHVRRDEQWAVTISDASNDSHTERFRELDWAREFANTAYKALPRFTDETGQATADPEWIADSVAYELDEPVQMCECEMDWKCPLCVEIGRYHSILDR